jgi:hypothetical protein
VGRDEGEEVVGGVIEVGRGGRRWREGRGRGGKRWEEVGRGGERRRGDRSVAVVVGGGGGGWEVEVERRGGEREIDLWLVLLLKNRSVVVCRGGKRWREGGEEGR